MELGNMIFGNSRGEYHAERGDALLAQFERLAVALGCDTYFSPGFENDTFAVRPYYWGDCTCGYENSEIKWCDSHDHSPECYQTEYRNAGLGEYSRDRDLALARDGRVIDLCRKHGIKYNNGYGCATHCDCHYDKEWREWASTHNHDPTCPTVLPNFHFKPTGFTLKWYKYPLRDSYSSEPLTLDKLRGMIHECIRSLGKDPLDY